jgi:SAM-dependent methyltransferase
VTNTNPPTLKTRVYPENAFGGFTRCDTTIAFYGRLNALVQSTHRVLDVGCGRAAYVKDATDSPYRANLRCFKGKAKEVVGIDVDTAGETNTSIDTFHLIEDVDHWPVEDASFDVVFSDFVMEHVDNPAAFLAEATRVLKPGGLLAMRTPNRWSYVSIAASLIPNSMHGKVTGAVQEDREEEDVFPVRYRCNTRRALRVALHKAGFDSAVWAIEGEPAYMTFSSLAYRIGSIAHRIMPGPFKTTLLAFARKR